MKITNIISWMLRIGASFILLQTLYFKFTGQPESVELFTKLGAEPWGRIGSGMIELIASILLIVPKTTLWGALMGIGLMGGAISSHLLVIGIESKADGGQLFILALIVMACCIMLTIIHKKQGIDLARRLLGKKRNIFKI